VGTLTAVGTATGWLFFLLLLVAIGSVGTRWLILPRAEGLEDRAGLLTATAGIGLFSTLGLVPALVGLLHRQVQELRFPGDPWLDAAQTVLGTSWGDAWWLAFWAAFMGILSFAGAYKGRLDRVARRLAWATATMALLPLAFFPGRTGHANAAASRTLALALDALHIVSAGLWIGGLGVLLLLAWRHRGGADVLASLVPKFSPVAMGSVGLLVASGAWAGWRELDTFGALWQTSYGRLLVLKVALVGGVLALGAINWKRLSPRLGSETGNRAMRRSATAEFLLANVVLIVTAILVRTSP